MNCICIFFFFKQKTAYEMRISDWSSDVCSSDLAGRRLRRPLLQPLDHRGRDVPLHVDRQLGSQVEDERDEMGIVPLGKPRGRIEPLHARWAVVEMDQAGCVGHGRLLCPTISSEG